MSFDGFPEEALLFYEGLCADNTKAYWTDHKAVYDTCVKAPFEALLAQLEPEFGAAKLFRPYRDVRFAKDKTPYKEHAGAVAHDVDGSTGLYVQLSAEGLYVGGGSWHLASDQLARLRAAIDDEASGRALVKTLSALDKKGWRRIGDSLVRVPRPYDKEHPRAELLKVKSIAVGQAFEPAEWLHEPACADRVAAAWRAVSPLNDWLRRHVGPSRLETPGRR